MSFSRIKKYAIGAAVLLSLVGFVLFVAPYLIPVEVQGKFVQEIANCNFVEKQLRFSCYRNVLENYYKGGDIKSFLDKVENNASLSFKGKDTSYAIFGTNSHTFYHAVGDFIAINNREVDIQSALNLCSRSSTNGCMMGLYKRTALEAGFPTDLLKEFYDVCREEEKYQCVHEIGHVLHDKYTTSILGILDSLTEEQYDLRYSEEYSYTLFENANLNAPFEECKQIVPEDEYAYCYTGVGHNLFLFSEFSRDGYKTQFQECMDIKEDNREECFGFLLFRIGINSVASKFLSSQFVEGNEICKDATAIIGRDDLTYHCYKGVGGGIGLFIESEYPKYFIDAELPIFNEDFTVNDIKDIKRVLLDFATLCESSPEEAMQTECFKGLLGTRFNILYLLFGVKHEQIEKLLPNLDDFEISG